MIKFTEFECEGVIKKLKTPMPLIKSEYEIKYGNMVLLECPCFEIWGRGHTLGEAMKELQTSFCVMYLDAKRVMELVDE